MNQLPPRYPDAQLSSQPAASVHEAINQEASHGVRPTHIADGIRVTNGEWVFILVLALELKEEYQRLAS